MKRYSTTPYLLWMTLFVVIPIAVIFFYAFAKVDNGITFSTEAIQRLIDPDVVEIMLRSFWLALLATLLCLLIGYPVAYMMSKASTRGRQMLVVLIVLPMWMNFLLRTYALQYLLGPTGLINSLITALGFKALPLLFNQGAVLFGMVYNYIPFMILPIYTVISKMDKRLIEAAEDLGATKRLVFQRVILPLSMPGVLSGITMTFMPAVSTFVISALLGGGKQDLIGNLIERQFTLLYDWHFGSLLSFVLLLLILLLMNVINKLDDASEGELQ